VVAVAVVELLVKQVVLAVVAHETITVVVLVIRVLLVP
jgi:hypothetical protein